ncbi:MAG: DUF4136 domain-containing protein [Acidobacteria bacterium]|nr:DUF4136 domain-containing protein [Acidobacteriota bacterium]
MKRFLIVASLIALVTARQAWAVSVKEDYNPATDFSKYKSFRLKRGTPSSSPLTQAKIEKAISSVLTSKGLTAAGDDAGLIIYTHVKIGVEKALDVSSFGYGGYFGWGGWDGDFGGTSVNVVDVPTGTLMVDMVDSSSQQMVWRGIASGTLPSKTTEEKSEQRINKAVAKLLKKFPPPAKK